MATTVTIVVDTDGTSGDYASLNAAITAEAGDIVTADEQHTYSCQATNGDADTAAVDVDGYTVDSTRYVKCIVNESYRHEGKYATTRDSDNENIYRLTNTFELSNDYTQFIGFLVVAGGSSLIPGIAAPTNVLIDRLYLRYTGTTYALMLASASTTCQCSIIECTGTSASEDFRGLRLRSSSYIYNCMVIGAGVGFRNETASALVQNCIALDCSEYGFQELSAFNASSSNNLSDDNTAIGTDPITNAIVKDATTDTLTAASKSTDNWVIFSDPDNGDYSLHSEVDGSELNDAIGAGTDVGLTYDIAGNVWDDPPSIGAFEYVGDAGTTITVTTTLDALVKRTGITAGTSIGSLLQDSKSTTLSVGSLLQAGKTSTVDLDAIIQAVKNSTITTDALLQAAKSSNLSVEAFLQTVFESVLDIDTLLSDSKTSEIVIDSILEALKTVTLSVDGLIENDKTSTLNIDSLLRTINSETLSLDSLLQIVGTGTTDLDVLLEAVKTSTVEIDAYVQSLKSETVSVDSIIQKVLTSATTLDAYITTPGTNTILTYIGAMVQKGVIETTSIEALIATLAETVTSSIDSLIQATKFGVVSLDAIITGVTEHTETINLDTLIQAIESREISFDSLIQGSKNINTEIDSIISMIGTSEVSIDSLLQQSKTNTLLLDSLIEATMNETITLDALISASASAGTSVDSVLALMITAGVDLDSILQRTYTSGLSINAILGELLIRARGTVTARSRTFSVTARSRTFSITAGN